jgi:hypothetical protein
MTTNAITPTEEEAKPTLYGTAKRRASTIGDSGTVRQANSTLLSPSFRIRAAEAPKTASGKIRKVKTI